MTLRAATARPRRHVSRRMALRGLGSVPEVTVVHGVVVPQRDVVKLMVEAVPTGLPP
jgi:hypothetical protein